MMAKKDLDSEIKKNMGIGKMEIETDKNGRKYRVINGKKCYTAEEIEAEFKKLPDED